MTDTATLIDTVMQAPAERRDAIIAAACGADRPKPGNIRQAAAILECNTRTVSRYAAAGMLHPIRISPRRTRYDLNEVERLATRGADAMQAGA